jgi:type IV pilus assembly protein PilP
MRAPAVLAQALACAAVALAAGCGGDEHSDLREELNQLTKDMRGRVDPLPQVRPYEPVPYTAETQVDPFRPERIEVASAGRAASASTSLIEEQKKRPPEPLEAFPLEAITMLGTITQNQETFALVKAGPNLYRVKKGNYMGQNFGVITSIDEAQISLKELVQDSTGDGVERVSALQLVEAKRGIPKPPQPSSTRCFSGWPASAGRPPKETASTRSTSRRSGVAPWCASPPRSR